MLTSLHSLWKEIQKSVPIKCICSISLKLMNAFEVPWVPRKMFFNIRTYIACVRLQISITISKSKGVIFATSYMWYVSNKWAIEWSWNCKKKTKENNRQTTVYRQKYTDQHEHRQIPGELYQVLKGKQMNFRIKTPVGSSCKNNYEIIRRKSGRIVITMIVKYTSSYVKHNFHNSP